MGHFRRRWKPATSVRAHPRHHRNVWGEWWQASLLRAVRVRNRQVRSTRTTVQVNWHTDLSQPALQSGHYYRVSVSVAGSRLGFLDVVALVGGAQVKNYRTGDIVPLVNGRTLPIRFRIEQLPVPIGSSGGTAVLAGGAVTLSFPAGAVTGDIEVTATAKTVGGDGTDTSILPGTRYDFQPSPTEFSAPVMLTLTYPSALPRGIHATRLAVCKMISGSCRPIAGSHVDDGTRTVTAAITSFSEYGISEWPEIMRWVYNYNSWSGQGTPVEGSMSTASGEIVVIPNGAEGPGDAAEWSPDGNHIAYMAIAPDGGNEIRVANADGTGSVELFHHPIRARFARWSPAGDKILFLGWDDQYCDSEGCVLMVMSTSGTGLVQIAITNDWFNAAAWSPDGQEIAFPNSSWQGVGCICAVNADGSGVHALRTGVTNVGQHYSVSGVAWSPDGTKIAFEGVDNSTGNQRAGLFVMNADGSNLRHLVSGTIYGVAWSPIGESIILFTRYDNGPEIYTIQSNGSDERFLGNGAIPSWSPDGQRVAFTSDGKVWVINLDGTGLNQVAVGLDPFWRP